LFLLSQRFFLARKASREVNSPPGVLQLLSMCREQQFGILKPESSRESFLNSACSSLWGYYAFNCQAAD
jgi:hypothetical protein